MKIWVKNSENKTKIDCISCSDKKRVFVIYVCKFWAFLQPPAAFLVENNGLLSIDGITLE
jgi:hypothetical protein